MGGEENELLTQTGQGTLCGELMRRYWQPAALSDEVVPGGTPLPVKLFGEDLVLFRDDEGRPGLLGLHCSHRGADLSYGRVEDGGLRCIYHGWLYDIHGGCLDQPGEPGGGEHRGSIRHPAYPCVEAAGVVFAYLGPGDPPLFPNYEFLNASEKYTTIGKYFHNCNYLQANEGNIDLSHLTFLHYLNRDPGAADKSLDPRGAAPTIEEAEAELTGFGVRSCKIRRDPESNEYRLYITDFVVPNFTAHWGNIGNGKKGYSVNWHVSIDDTHHWKYMFSFRRDQRLDPEQDRRWRRDVDSNFKFLRNGTNRYLQDRETMQKEVYTGLGHSFPLHDCWATESQGSIQDRANEHLVSMDKPILAARKILRNAIMAVKEGKDPPNVVRDPKLNRFHIIATDDVVPCSKDWKEFCKELEALVP